MDARSYAYIFKQSLFFTMTDSSDSSLSFSQALPAGLKLGQYCIIQPLAVSSLGYMYHARELETNQEVIIKENLPFHYACRKEGSYEVQACSEAHQKRYEWYVNVLLNEARLLTKLQHSNITQVIKAFKVLGTSYYVMPWHKEKLLEEAAPSPDDITEKWLSPILQSSLSALKYLHTNNLLHRNLNLSSILVTDDGSPLITGFHAVCSLSGVQTAPKIKETVGYTPIEMLQDGKMGAWSDIYSLGAVCYYLLTGELPVGSAERMAHGDCYKPLEAQPFLYANFSRDFLLSIDKALELKPENRWQSAEEWLTVLGGQRAIANLMAMPTAPMSSSVTPLACPSSTSAGKEILSSPSFDAKETAPMPSDDSLTKKSSQSSSKRTVLVILSLVSILALGAGLGFYSYFKAEEEKRVAAEAQQMEQQRLAEIQRLEREKAEREAQARREQEEREEQARLAEQAERERIEEARRAEEQRIAAEKQAVIDRKNNAVQALADMQVSSSDYGSRFLQAAANGELDVIENLLIAEADVNVMNEQGETPLYVAAAHGQASCLRALLQIPGINVNTVNNNNDTLLMAAASNGHVDCIHLLSQTNGVLSNSVNNNQQTALMLAASKGHQDCVNALLQIDGLLPNITDADGNTALMHAVQNNHLACVETLLSHSDIQVNHKNTNSLTALDYSKNSAMTQLLKDKGATSGKPPVVNKTPKKNTSSTRRTTQRSSRSSGNRFYGAGGTKGGGHINYPPSHWGSRHRSNRNSWGPPDRGGYYRGGSKAGRW